MSEQKSGQKSGFSSGNSHVDETEGEFNEDILKEIEKLATGTPRQARRIRSWVIKLQAMKLSDNALAGLFRLASIYLSTGMGQWLFTVLLIFWLHNRKFLSDITADELFAILTTVDVIKAIGSSNVLSQVEALAGLFTGGGA